MSDSSLRTTAAETQPLQLTGNARELSEKLASKTATIGVVGLGYVGLPLAVEFAKRGHRTIGIDLNSERVLRLNAGQNLIEDVDDEDLRDVVDDETFVAVDDFSRGSEIDVFFICVPTPLTSSNRYTSNSTSIAE